MRSGTGEGGGVAAAQEDEDGDDGEGAADDGGDEGGLPELAEGAYVCFLRVCRQVEDGDGLAEPGVVFAADVGGDGDGFSIGGSEAEDGEIGASVGAFGGGLAECDDLAGGGLSLGEEDGTAGGVYEADGDDKAEEEVSQGLLKKDWHGWECSRGANAPGRRVFCAGAGAVWEDVCGKEHAIDAGGRG